MTDSSSRQQIMANIQRGLGRGEPSPDARQTVLQRLQQHPCHTIPARSQLERSQQIDLFKQMALEASSELHGLTSIRDLPQAVGDFLQQNKLTQLVMASSRQLTELDWNSVAGVEIEQRVAQAGDSVSLTSSFAGIAETGTLLLHSAPDSPTTLNFLPDIHLVVLQQSRIVGCYEQVWQQLRDKTGDWPRTINMITGPSRSADIEQKLQMGAHGPKRLVIFLLDDAAS